MDHTLQQQILAQGMSPEKAQEQIENFKSGFPFLPIVEAAKVGNGIRKFNEDEIKRYGKQFDQLVQEKDILKFVPASGAASRMFKDLFAFLDGDGKLENNAFAKKFIDNIEKFAFHKDLNQALEKDGSSISKALEDKDYTLIISYLLEEKGLGYGSLPKALLKFHHYSEQDRTPTYEHFVEGVMYAKGKGDKVNIHFTVSPEHEEKFKEEIAEIQPKLEKEHGVTFEVSFSQQKQSTDTIAVNPDNTPFIEEDGSILFRPAGHGALLENLNEIDADLIFIKNVDNVVPDRLKDTTQAYKKALGALLLKVQDKVFHALENIEHDNLIAEEVFEVELAGKLPEEYKEWPLAQKQEFLKSKLNRPIRVCGMVRNVGEPGGGPFWVQEEDGSLSLQIAENAQIDLNDPEKKEIFNSATHFNPVDVVCGTKDFQGNKFDLLKHRDMKTGFITGKSKNGKELKALELPGLWNGSMADWNTIFVEVPIITFNPVKTVNDLLRDEHQN
ncbi:DUF4301 family protein [Litoribacter alkaliphilus]|uniref:DUF4301 family protein n=1 Tax=Litoribacter ruber TaxID=702568 RepID=A0AAP2G3F2_9BACT|nr:DUF4301 family protein [Litoribacter alkaliphilus]MBS9522428.1 DUF4301 family protein [Litoribacter alkaliphilus]